MPGNYADTTEVSIYFFRIRSRRNGADGSRAT